MTKVDQTVPVDTPDVTSPFGLLRFAEEYRWAANVVRRAKADEIPPTPALMLVGQSIELSLKAFLLARGISLQRLKSKAFGHDLEALLNEARRRRIDRLVPLHQFHDEAIKLFSPVYGRHEFRYIVTGVRTLPKWDFLAHAAAELTRCQHDWLLRRRVGKERAAKRIAVRGRFGRISE